MTPDGEAGALLAAEDDPSFFYIFADILETDGGFEQFAVVQCGNPIDEVGGCHSPGDAAFPASAFDQVIDQHGDELVGINEFGAFIENAESIGVAVGRE